MAEQQHRLQEEFQSGEILKNAAAACVDCLRLLSEKEEKTGLYG